MWKAFGWEGESTKLRSDMGFPVVALSDPFPTPEPQFPHLEMGSNNILGHLTVLLWGSVNMIDWRCSGKVQHIFTLGRRSLWLPQRALVLCGHRYRQKAKLGPFDTGAEPASFCPFKGNTLSSSLHFRGWNGGRPRACCQKAWVLKSSLGEG